MQNKVIRYITKFHKSNQNILNTCDASLMVTDRLAKDSVSIIPMIGKDIAITEAFQMSHYDALMLAHAILSKVLVSDEAKAKLKELENAIEYGQRAIPSKADHGDLWDQFGDASSLSNS